MLWTFLINLLLKSNTSLRYIKLKVYKNNMNHSMAEKIKIMFFFGNIIKILAFNHKKALKRKNHFFSNHNYWNISWVYKTLYTRLNIQVKQELDDFQINSYRDILRDVHPGEINLSFHTNRILLESHIIPPLSSNNRTSFTDEEKCAMLASHLEGSFKNQQPNQAIYEQVHHILNLECPTVQPSLKFKTPIEIKNYIKYLPYRKTPGEGMIPNIALKNLNTKAIVYLFTIFNACLRQVLFPSHGKTQSLEHFTKPVNRKTFQAAIDQPAF